MQRWTMALACALSGSGALSGCSGGGEDGAGGAPFGLDGRQPVTGLAFPAGPAAVGFVDAFPQLIFSAPVLVTHPPDGSDRLFVVEQGGAVRVFPNDPGAQTSALFLDLSALLMGGGERGLLGFAFDPDYATNGHVYVDYSAPPTTPGMDHRTVVARYTVSAGDPNAADAGSALVLLEVDQPYSNHNGGMLAFGPDGMLYVSLGDGGSGDDPLDAGQDMSTLLGKILRLTPDGGVPADNPFVGVAGVRPEIWASGLRNPWRFSFDRESGALWCGDVGQNAWEEIDLITRGADYGWDTYEGSHAHELGDAPAVQSVPPVIEYAHELGESVTGGVVYRGAANPELVGAYIYGDFTSGRVWALVYDGGQVLSNQQIATVSNPAAFGEDEAGELYVCSFDGKLYRVEPQVGGPPPDAPPRLSETGLFADTAALVAAPGVIEYDVNAPLWSDGASKRRWIALPGLERIGFQPEGDWAFPLGTVLVKHFELETAPGILRRLETRVLHRAVSGWRGYCYRWNAAQDDALLLTEGLDEPIPIADPLAPGGEREQIWSFPSRTDCQSCHTSAAGRVLGVRSAQLNREFEYPAVSDNQLRAWEHAGFFDAPVGDPATLAALPAPDDPGASLAARARAWLSVNCATCHLPGGPTPSTLDLRREVAAAEMNAIEVAPTAGDLGLPDARLIAPGERSRSVLWERIRRLDDTRMPPLGSHVVDELGLELVGQWIDAGAP